MTSGKKFLDQEHSTSINFHHTRNPEDVLQQRKIAINFFRAEKRNKHARGSVSEPASRARAGGRGKKVRGTFSRSFKLVSYRDGILKVYLTT